MFQCRPPGERKLLHSQKQPSFTDMQMCRRSKSAISWSVSFWTRFRETNERSWSSAFHSSLQILFDVCGLSGINETLQTKRDKPNCFDFIIIVVVGLLASFSCRRRRGCATCSNLSAQKTQQVKNTETCEKFPPEDQMQNVRKKSNDRKKEGKKEREP